ncbi:MAG: hypothetical protein KDC95_06200 [Planctomycetes bacterium]|nr:hypothetical protein [Planctomycetota bacterium]
MTQETASFWLHVIFVSALVIWGAGAVFLLRAESALAASVTREVPLDGVSRPFLKIFASRLSEIRSQMVRGIALDVVEPSRVRWHSSSGFIHHGEARLEASPTRLQWSFEEGAHAFRMTGRFLIVFGFVVIVALYFILRTYALPSAMPGMVFQMMQAIHVLWPPFLIGGLALHSRRCMVDEIERIAHNVRFEAVSAA